MSEKSKSLSDLYSDRIGKYIKPKAEEDFLKHINKTLSVKEQSFYKDCEINHPFIFIFGLPRSGTTLISQLVAHCMDVGFINNFMARFYQAPVHGIRLSRIIFGYEQKSYFQSDYAHTSEITDIHEFGYFWRYWLKKELFTGVTQAGQIEAEIDWSGLKYTLANIQNEFKKPMVFKNIFGSYHINKMNAVLNKVIFIYIKRDILDSAVSILDARKKYFTDLNTWWSYMPVEFEIIKDMDYWHQIAGQVFFLSQYYEKKTKNMNNVLIVDYRKLTQNPENVLNQVSKISSRLYNSPINIIKKPPKKFPFRSYNDRDEEKSCFSELISEFGTRYE